jgi:hypothetical protein
VIPSQGDPSLENLSDQPQMTEGVQHGPLQHPFDGARTIQGVFVLVHWTVPDGSRR